MVAFPSGSAQEGIVWYGVCDRNKERIQNQRINKYTLQKNQAKTDDVSISCSFPKRRGRASQTRPRDPCLLANYRTL